MNPNDLKASIYKLTAIDIPFEQSWQDWIDAVELGADFYDGDGDSSTREFAVNLFDTYQTNGIPAGTYSVTIYWKSDAAATGSNTLNLSTPAGNRTRGLLVQELI